MSDKDTQLIWEALNQKKAKQAINENEETDHAFWSRLTHEMSEEELKTIISRIEKYRENMMKKPIWDTGDFDKLDRRLEFYKAELRFRSSAPRSHTPGPGV